MRGGSIRRGWLLAVLIAIAVFGLEGEVKPSVTAENPVGFFEAGFSPKKLPKTKPTPIDLDFAAETMVPNGVVPPSLKQFVLQADRRIDIDVRGTPTCELGGLGVRPSIGQVRKRCRPALVGAGRIEALVQFGEQAPIPVKSELLVINGGLEGRVTKLHLHFFFPAPVVGWFVTTVEVKRIREGRFGLEALATFPKIAGGAGSITSFRISLEKDVVSATCGADRYLKVHGEAVFADGTRRSQPVVRTCIPLR